MAKGREESDGRVVPKGRRKAVPTAARPGGKATTASEAARQLTLFHETAEAPTGVHGDADAGQPASASLVAPKSWNKVGPVLPAMTIETVSTEENLRSAFQHVASNRGAPGPDRQGVDEVREHLDNILPVLGHALRSGHYQPGMVRRVWIPKPGGGQRGLGIPNVIDRLVQQAVYQILSPHYETTFHENSHGFRPGRSCHSAIADAKQHLEAGYDWVVDLDLEKFFDRVHHQRLLARLERKVHDRPLLDLIRRMLKAKVVMPDGVVVSTEEGTPQGGPLSPLLSNIVLDELDQELSRRGHRFVRYADDCNVYVRSERAGRRVMASIVAFIERRLRLKVNAAKSAVARPEERHFVGFSVRREPLDGGVEVTLSKRSKDRIYERIRALTPRMWGQSLRDCIRQINEYLRGWIGFFWICTDASTRTFRHLESHLRRRLRAIVLRQGSRRRRKRHLPGRKSWWARSFVANRTLPNAFFSERGLLSLEKEWLRYRTRSASAPGQLSLILE
jgi:RNA-directed DNA polymerase